MFTCKLTYRIEGDSEVHSFEVTVESHPEDINDEIWKAMIANDTGHCNKVKIIDISWVEINELSVTKIQKDMLDIKPQTTTIDITSIAEEKKKDELYNIITKAAQQHGQESDPEHEVGDLQDALRLGIDQMSPDQIERFHNEWKESQSN